MSDIEKMRLDKIERIKERMKFVHYPQPFCQKFYFDTNCMAYALGIKEPSNKIVIYSPGGFSGRICFLEKEHLIKNLLSDMEILGIQTEVISTEEAKQFTKKGTQIIALYQSKAENDFHFLRKDREGGWSHKLGYYSSPEKLKWYQYQNHLLTDVGIYELVAFFRLSFQ